MTGPWIDWPDDDLRASIRPGLARPDWSTEMTVRLRPGAG